MTTLTQDQTAALDAIEKFLVDRTPDPKTGIIPTTFLLEGGAGTGKTFLLGQILERARRFGILCVATPTHKATNVLRKKLDAFGVGWTRGYDSYSYGGEVITGTTAQLLGIAPVVTDDQTSGEVKFGKKGSGILGKVTPALLVIDEVSMLGARDFLDLVSVGQKRGMKILAVGDAGQLPPVKQTAIPFEKFRRQAKLREIVRQAGDSAIIKVAWAIRDGQPWREIEGPGVRRLAEAQMLRGAFLEAVQAPGERPEEDREVFVAYRNVNVNAMAEAVCQKLYGHGRLAFAPGEMVLSETNLYRAKTLLCANQDELVVTRFHDEDADATIGVPVTLRHRGRRGEFQAHYLSPEQLADREHPYNVELRRLEGEAQRLQKEYNEKKRGPRGFLLDDLDRQRKQAWVNFFAWRDQTIISFRHPFAITSHKSQGSTYRAVFVDVADIARKSSQALYVAVTRPREELVL